MSRDFRRAYVESQARVVARDQEIYRLRAKLGEYAAYDPSAVEVLEYTAAPRVRPAEDPRVQTLLERWQAERHEYHGPPVIEILEEFAQWLLQNPEMTCGS